MASTLQTTLQTNPAVRDALNNAVVKPMSELRNPNARRKAHDIRQLLAKDWNGRLAVVGAGPGPRRSLAVTLRMKVNGLIYDERPRPWDLFEVTLFIPENYPLAEPDVQFVGGNTPFNMNVLHKDFLPNPHGLPPQLRQILSDGVDGVCCYQLGEWTTSLDRNLNLVVFQLSKILTGAKIRGEKFSLNFAARDHYLRMREEGQLPLGDPLPIPVAAGDVQAHAFAAHDEAGTDDAIEWLDGEASERQGDR